MQSRKQAELEALRQRLAEQNRRWEDAKELLTGRRRAIDVTPELLAAIDRACEAPALGRSAPRSIHPGAIRA